MKREIVTKVIQVIHTKLVYIPHTKIVKEAGPVCKPAGINLLNWIPWHTVGAIVIVGVLIWIFLMLRARRSRVSGGLLSAYNDIPYHYRDDGPPRLY